ncbi:MAG: alpha/beta hydrolase [Alphaproteobacteria bacterium]|nr:alpha/beta hydrolase [Alphaproteobacteria bacterium]
MDLSFVRFTRRVCGEVTLHVAEAGPDDGPLVILLHGFPEFWFGWRYQIGALADSGFHVVVPDQRGYNLSDKPHGIARYDTDLLAADVIALAAHYSADAFNLVGHDWGAVVAWWVATRYPEKVRRLAVLNCPHPAVAQEIIRKDSAQRRASWYIAAFQIPWLPEAMLRADGYRGLLQAVRGSRTLVTDEEAERYREAWRQPGALTGMINWYRAAPRHRFDPVAAGALKMPVQIIWGRQDPYVLPQLAEASVKLCADGHLTFLPDATHWVAHEEPDGVNAMLTDFLK